MISFNARLDGLGDVNDFMAKFGLEEHGRVQQAIDQMVIDYSLPYWAWDTGALANSAYSASDIGSGTIVYPGPYASYQYYGVSRSGLPLNYNKETNPMAGSFPIERMKADHMTDIIEEAKRVALGG